MPNTAKNFKKDFECGGKTFAVKYGTKAVVDRLAKLKPNNTTIFFITFPLHKGVMGRFQ